MILTLEELRKLKWLIPGENSMFIYTGKGKATKKEIEAIIDFDKDNYELFDGHIVENYEDLISN